MKTTCYATNWRGIGTAFLLTAITAVPSPFLLSALTSRSISTDELLVLLKGLEETTAVLEYDVRYSEYRGPSDAKVNFDEPLQKWEDAGYPTGVQKTAHFLLEYGTGRVNFTREGTGRAYVPETKERFLSQIRRSLAFDGVARTQMVWDLDEAGAHGSGIISSQPLKPNKELSTFETGLDVILPFYRGVGLSRHLSSDSVDRSSIRAELRSDGILEVSYVGTAKGQKFGLSIDLQKGGAILQETCYSTRRPDSVVARSENTWEKDSEGNWVPRSSLYVGGTLSPSISKLSFEAVKRNHFEPTPEMFRIEFPPGTDVSDHRTGLYYVVGAPPAELAEDVTATLVKTREMSGRSGQADANAAMPGHELAREPSEAGDAPVTGGMPEADASEADAPAVVAEGDRRRGPWVVIGGVLAVAVVLAVWAVSRKKAGKTLPGARLILVAAVVALSGSDVRAQVATEKAFYGWAAPGAGDRQIPIYQCGLAATMYALQYFGQTHRAEDLMDLMVPSIKGISLMDMMRAMEVHGLETSARSAVRARDLQAALTDYRIAILPTRPAGEKGHFYVIVPGKGSSLLLVDAGRSVKAQSLHEMQKRLRANGGLVAFVWVRQQGEDADAVTIDPQAADLGRFHSSDPLATAKFRIRNHSKRCVLVTAVAPACSCTASGWKRGLLSPGEEVAIDMSLRPKALKAGPVKKSIAFHFADGSSQVAHVVGQCLGPEQSQGIRVSPTEVYLDFAETQDPQTRQLKVIGKGPVHVAVSDANWVSARVTRQPTSAPGTIEIVADPNHLAGNRDAGVLHVWVVDREPRLAIPIHAVCAKPYKVERRIVTLDRGDGSKSGAFIIRRDAKAVSEIHVDTIACDLDGIRVQSARNESGSQIRLNVVDRESLVSGLHPIDLRVRVGSASERLYSERVYVMVR